MHQPSDPTQRPSDHQIESYRYINVEDNHWAEHIQDSLRARMRAIGVDVSDIYWSGFCSQGDGACFTGYVSSWGLYLAHLGYDHPTLVDVANNNWELSWDQHGRYYHENSVRFFTEEVYVPDNPYRYRYGGGGVWARALTDEDQFRAAAWDAYMASVDLDALVDKIKEDLRGHMMALYRELEAEYDYLTSDEAVAETLIFNPELTYED